MISVLIYTRNEERNIADCLATVRWSDDIHVVDSNSDDATVHIARSLGARVVSRSYIDESEQKNWAIRALPFKYDWVFQIDADERCTAELAASMRAAVAAPGERVAFRFQRRDFFMGVWIQHVQAQRYSLRLIRRDAVQYERVVNPVCHIRGLVGSLAGYLDHYPFSKGIDQWIERHNRYSRLEAREVTANRTSLLWADVCKSFTERDYHARRYHQKRLFYRLPHRPALKFLFLYLLRRGFLDGRAGFHYALLQSWYEYMIVLKSATVGNETADAEARNVECRAVTEQDEVSL